MKQAPAPAKAVVEQCPTRACVICFKQCRPWGRTSEGNHLCGVDHANEWYHLTLEERQRRENVASQKVG